MKHYIDLHTHTTYSDGAYSARKLIDLAAESGIQILAMTEHNCMAPDFEELRQYALTKGIQLIPGMEISCLYETVSKQTVMLHIVALHFDLDNTTLFDLIKNYNIGQREHVTLILDRLKTEFQMELGTYDTILAKHPDSFHVGRMFICEEMVEKGYVDTVSDGFDIYIGSYGQKKAYVPSPIQYADLKTTLEAIMDAHGIPILAHLYYYQLSDEDNRALLKEFKEICGEMGAMEVFYSLYTHEQQMVLFKLATEFDLMISAGSDFHGQHEHSKLHNQCELETYEKLEERRKEVYHLM